MGGKRLRFTDDQRRRLAVKAKELGRKVLIELGAIVTPETLQAWHRQLSANSGCSRQSGARHRSWHDRSEIMARNGIEPAPERGRKVTWKEFLEQHWDLMVAADFFTVEAWTRRGLPRKRVMM